MAFLGIFSTEKKRKKSKDVKAPKAPKQPPVNGTKKQWDAYAVKLADYNKKVDAVNKEVNRRKTLQSAKAKIEKKK